jgi:hypothetical protein
MEKQAGIYESCDKPRVHKKHEIPWQFEWLLSAQGRLSIMAVIIIEFIVKYHNVVVDISAWYSRDPWLGSQLGNQTPWDF